MVGGLRFLRARKCCRLEWRGPGISGAELAGQKSFTSRYLAPADQTLGDYLSR
jgi:hypothetical protein